MTDLAKQALDKIRLYFPQTLSARFEPYTGSAEADQLMRRCRDEREAWESGTPTEGNRERLRQDVFAFARTNPDSAEPDELQAFFDDAAAIGTP